MLTTRHRPSASPLRRLRFGGLAVATILAAAVATTSGAQEAFSVIVPNNTIDWEVTAGPDGGGATSALASDNRGTLVAGGDTQGLFRSTDGGASWKPSSLSIPPSDVDGSLTTDYMKVASVLYVPKVAGGAGRWFAGVGGGGHGAVLASADGGQWTRMPGQTTVNNVTTTVPVFAGANTDFKVLSLTRSTGNLLASDGTYLYAGSYRDGVYRCKLSTTVTGGCVDGTAPTVWTLRGLAPKTNSDNTKTYNYIRSIALDTTTKRLYVAYVEGKVTSSNTLGTTATRVAYQDLSTNGSWVQVGLPTGTSFIEELKLVPATLASGAVGQVLYAVGEGGIYRLSRTIAAATLESLTAHALPVDPALTTETESGPWTSIDGVSTSSGSRLVLSNARQSDGTATHRRTAYLDVRETSGRAVPGTIMPLDTEDATSGAPVNPVVAGTTRTWDLLTSREDEVLGQHLFRGFQVLITPSYQATSGGTTVTVPSRLWVAGKMAVYRRDWSPTATPPVSGGSWEASVNGLANTFAYGVTTRAYMPTPQVAWPDADLNVLKTDHTVAAATRCPDKGTKAGMTWGLTYLRDGQALMATGLQAQGKYGNGDLWYGSVDTCTWRNTGINVVNPNPDQHLRVPAFAAVMDDSGSTTITAYVSGVGLVRGTGVLGKQQWQRISSNLKLLPGSSSAVQLSPLVIADSDLAEIETDPTAPATPEATKGLSLITVTEPTAENGNVQTIVVARPQSQTTSMTAWGVHVCMIKVQSGTANCHPVKDSAGNALGSQKFNSLAADPTLPGVVFWSAPGGSTEPATSKGVWRFDTASLSADNTNAVVAVKDSSAPVGGALAVTMNAAGGQSLYLVAGYPGQVSGTSGATATVWRKFLSEQTTGFVPYGPSSGLFQDDAVARGGMPVSGVTLAPDFAPGADMNWRLFVSTLGGGVVSGLVGNP